MAEKVIKSHDCNLIEAKLNQMKNKEKKEIQKKKKKKLDQTAHLNNKIHVDTGINPKENIKVEYS